MWNELPKYIENVIAAHQQFSKTPDKSTRHWDKKTPYVIHPLWCATMIAMETSLPEHLRQEGAVTLLFHDMLEDTTVGLPHNLPEAVYQDVQDMTFPGGTIAQERFEIWSKEPKIRLFKLYDKVSNLLDATWMSDDLREKYINYTQRLTNDVESNFGQLHIVKLAHAIID